MLLRFYAVDPSLRVHPDDVLGELLRFKVMRVGPLSKLEDQSLVRSKVARKKIRLSSILLTRKMD